MTIQEVIARPICVPMAQPHRTASGVISESPLLLIDLLLDGGIVGRSILFTYTSAALEPVARLVQSISEGLMDQPLAPALLSDQLARRFRLLGTQGLVGMALAGLDMAMWDALANLHGVPLANLLGGEPRSMPAYGAVGYDGAFDSAKTAEDWAKRGFRGVKAKIGYPTVREDLEVIRAIRSAAGPDMAIMVDYNQSLTPTDAIERLRYLEDERLTWVEEPVLATDYPGMAEVAREIRTPIQAGENWWGPEELRHALDVHASDYVMLDVMKIGGVTGWQRAAAMSAAKGMRVSSHLWSEISAQLLSVTPGAHWVEFADWWSPVLQQPLEVKDGLTVPSAGQLRWNESFIEAI